MAGIDRCTGVSESLRGKSYHVGMIRFASFCYGMKVMDRKILVRLADFADRLNGPLGAVPLDRAIRSDLELFITLRSTGVTWVQIANALASAGARRPDGGVISADHVRSAISRQLKRAVANAAAPDVGEVATAQPLKEAATQPNREPGAQRNGGIAPAAWMPSSGRAVSAKPDQKKPASQRNTSILEKLARARQLRES